MVKSPIRFIANLCLSCGILSIGSQAFLSPLPHRATKDFSQHRHQGGQWPSPSGLPYNPPTNNSNSSDASSSKETRTTTNSDDDEGTSVKANRYSKFAPSADLEADEFRSQLKENMKADLERRRNEDPARGNQPAKTYLDAL